MMGGPGATGCRGRGRTARRVLVTALVGALLGGLGGCGGHPPGGDAAPTGPPAVLDVPGHFRSIQAAVDHARPGDTVLVHPGEYHESVQLRTPRVVLRGTDRQGVVVDGDFRRANGITVTGAQSVVENLTVRHHLANGVLFTGVTDERLQQHGAGGSGYNPLDTVRFPELNGFRASYVTAYGNALYGIYAFDARAGVIEHSYASGQADSGIYVGQCHPCDTVVRANEVEHNAVGIEITNASENLAFLGNRVARNRVGVTLNSNDVEALAPQHGAVLAGNVIVDDNDPASPEQADGGFGIGVGVGGGTGNLLTRNLVSGNSAAGVLISDVQGHPAGANLVAGNRITGNGVDEVLAAGPDAGNCFTDQPATAATGTAPPGPCLPVAAAAAQPPAPPGVSFRDLPPAPARPGMPDPGAPGVPAVGLPGPVSPDAYPLPTDPGAVPPGPAGS
ncbi:nitrous oxidase accessory protein NosD [Kitasatospora viridis]|uniref:Nitrous oxidase accessory protein NosD n=2 Tax=Kitasatospora viridis TaxID=281105 RepID=A0A561SEH9_9ACTN|nr:nitrous oxidase accessory protein NosD [Kitasatospora viridis]